MTDLAATLPNLWQRLSTALSDTKADTSLPATPNAAPATETDAVPEVPVPLPHPPAHYPPTAPTKPSAKDAPRLSPVPLSGPPASEHPAAATITAPAPQTTPDIAAPSAPVMHGSRPLSNTARSFRHHTQSFARWRRRPFRCCRTLACTGPP